MKKTVFSYLIVFVAISSLWVSCKQNDVASNYNVSVVLKAPESITLPDVKNLKVIAVSITTGVETEIAITDGKGTETLSAGEYNFRASGETEDFNLNGLTNTSVYEDKEVLIELNISAGNGIIFKEVYFSGVASYYWKDGFYEIYNNSEEVQYLDGIILGIVANGMGEPTPWVDTNGNLLERYPMDNHTVYFPGSGQEYPLQPGKSAVIATVAINHSARELTAEDKQSPVDLSKADWNIYIPTQSTDIQVAGIPDMKVAYSLWGFDFFPGVFGTPLILAKLPQGVSIESFIADENNYQLDPEYGYDNNLMIPREYVIDAIDIVRPEENKRFKSLHASEDVGMTWIWGEGGPGTSAAYSGKSLRRKVISITTDGRAVYKDTNNSSEDFILGGQIPTPGVHPNTVD